MGRARDLANILSSSGNVALDSELGLTLITPTSVATTGGSATISSSGAVSFTGAVSVSLNDVFSSSYDNYRIFISLTASAEAAYLTLRLRVSGADNTTTNYRYGNILLNTQNGQTLSYRNNNSAQGISLVRTENNNNVYDASFDVGQPFATLFTTFKGNGTNTAVSGNNYGETQSINGFFIDSVSFTGFTIFGPSSMGGKIRVYGYRN
jgi:hypothetical protein